MDVAKKNKGFHLQKNINIKSYAIILIIIIMFFFFNIKTDGIFLGNRNISNLLRQMTVVTILATGMFFVVLTGNIDISVGSMLGMIGGFVAVALTKYEINPIIVIVAAMLCGCLIGLIQGVVVSYVGVPSFIVTLGANLAYRGIVIGMTGGASIAIHNSLYSKVAGYYLPSSAGLAVAVIANILAIIVVVMSYKSKKRYNLHSESICKMVLKILVFSMIIWCITLYLNSYQGFPLLVLIMFLVIVICTAIADKTTFGRNLYAIGGNAQSAKYAGIAVKKYTMLSFAVCGLMTGLAAVVLTSRVNAATPNTGNTMEMDAIAATVIGGASLAGGVGKVPGVLLGALIMAALDNGMSVMNIESFWQDIVKGLVLIIAVAIDVISKKKG